MHPWHHVSWFTRSLSIIPVVVKVPVGSEVVYELDRRTGLLRVEQVLARKFPATLGFVPKACTPEGDALEAWVLGDTPLTPLSILRSRPLGLVRGSGETGLPLIRLLAVHCEDPTLGGYGDMSEFPDRILRDLAAFSHGGKDLTFGTRQQAMELLGHAVDAYATRYKLKREAPVL